MSEAARTDEKLATDVPRVEVPDLSLHTPAVRAVGDKYGFDAAHAAQVAALALQLFSGMPAGIHGLGAEWVVPLEHAALLHDIGYFVSSRGHHRHSAYLIRRDALLADYPDAWRELVALIARNHRKRPRKSPREWDRRIAAGGAALAAILRIADGLDFGHDAAAHLGGVQLRRGALEIAVGGVRLSALHPVLVKKSRLFTRTFGMPVTFVGLERRALRAEPSRRGAGKRPRADRAD